jgi:hypothetical protein
MLSRRAEKGSCLKDDEMRSVIATAWPSVKRTGKRVLMIVSDRTRTCPLGLFQSVFEEAGATASAFDVMIALGTHQPMSEDSIATVWRLQLKNVAQPTGVCGY